jgi:hypothetical protein
MAALRAASAFAWAALLAGLVAFVRFMVAAASFRDIRPRVFDTGFDIKGISLPYTHIILHFDMNVKRNRTNAWNFFLDKNGFL